jgi:hypothetical protein
MILNFFLKRPERRGRKKAESGQEKFSGRAYQ